MLRDLGTQRVPAGDARRIGSGIIFAVTLFLLHRREKLVNQHVSAAESGTSGSRLGREVSA